MVTTISNQTKTSIGLYDGSFFDFNKPDDCDFDIGVIAHSLSNICRYGGHSKKFYSVAEHSVLVSRVVPPRLALVGLLHDASEAFVGDMPSPLKKLCQSYRTIEDRVQAAIARKYSLPYPFPEEIHLADKAVYRAEREQIAGGDDNLWYVDHKPADVMVVGLAPKHAKAFFLGRYHELTEGLRKAA